MVIAELSVSEIDIKEESWGMKARRLWEETFSEFEHIDSKHVQFLNTGIGGAPISDEMGSVRIFPDTSRIPEFKDLKKEFNVKECPEVLFLIASPLLADDVISLKTVALHYKEQGVKKIIAVMTSLAHERQDHMFYDSARNPITEGTTLKSIISTITAEDYIQRPNEDPVIERVIDGGIIVQPHSLRPIEIAHRIKFPLLPIDPFDYIVDQAELEDIEKGYTLEPDEGRRRQGKKLAELKGWPIGSGDKTRDRLKEGKPTVVIPTEVLKMISEEGYTAVVFDDEVRQAGTSKDIARQVRKLVLIIVKLICSEHAVSNLADPSIIKIVTTDAVKPQNVISPIWHKVKPVYLMPGLVKMIDYLKRNLVSPNDENWLDPSQTGTLLRLDMSIETYH